MTPAFVPAALALLTLGLAFAQLGTVVPDRAMPCLDGNRHALVDQQRLTVLSVLLEVVRGLGLE